MTRSIRFLAPAWLAAWLVAAALPARAAEGAAPVDPSIAKAAAEGAVCPAGQLEAEQLPLHHERAVAEISQLLAADTPPDPEIRVLNRTGFNYAPPGVAMPAPPASPAPAPAPKQR